MKKTILPCLLAALLLAGCAAEPVDPPATTQTQPAPEENTGFSLGETLSPMSVTTADGETVSVQQVLEEKKLVVLNFWYVDCVWCQREFPALELAYSRYQPEVEVFALNPLDEQSAADSFWESHTMTMPMGVCNRDTALLFGVNGYPTSVFIDRCGKICLIHSGAITDPSTFYDLFDHFTAEDYVSKSYNSLQELLGTK